MKIHRSPSQSKCPACAGSGEKPSDPDGIIVLPCSVCNGSGNVREAPDEGSNDDQVLFYIDQNIISEMRAGSYKIPSHRLFDLSQQRKHADRGVIRYVYSNETLAEISRTGRPTEYLEQLEALQAQKLLEYIDIQNPAVRWKSASNTGKLQPLFEYIDPAVFYAFYEKRIDNDEEATSDAILFANMVTHVASLLGITPARYDLFDFKNAEVCEELVRIIEKIRIAISASEFQNISSLELSNPMEYIWENFIRPKLRFEKITENIFFSFQRADSVTSNIVNSHIVLNILGYYSDDNKKLISNIQGFMSDARHVNMALRTDVFITYDRKLAYRAAALYKWENCKTGFNLMTVFKRFGRNDVVGYIASEGETADQASDRSKCLYTSGKLIYSG